MKYRNKKKTMYKLREKKNQRSWNWIIEKGRHSIHARKLIARFAFRFQGFRRRVRFSIVTLSPEIRFSTNFPPARFRLILRYTHFDSVIWFVFVDTIVLFFRNHYSIWFFIFFYVSSLTFLVEAFRFLVSLRLDSAFESAGFFFQWMPIFPSLLLISPRVFP